MEKLDEEVRLVLEHIDGNFDAHLERLQSYLRQPSISAKGEGIAQCAEMTKGFIEELGGEAKLVSYNNGHPIVYGSLKSKGAKRTLLHYNMYDTQPLEPLDKWISPPLDANIVRVSPFGDCIIARGARNTKGPLLAFMNALKSIQETGVDIPVNLIFVFEGEEEIGSPSLPKFVNEYAKELKVADDTYMHWCGEFFRPGVPIIFLGFKGWLPLELEVEAMEENVHSEFKPIVDSAVWRLIWALNSICDVTDCIIVDDFFDQVKSTSDEDIMLLEKLAEELDEESLKNKVFGPLARKPDKWRKNLHGIELLRAYCFEPTINVSGLISGYVGSKIQNITPARALAKLDVRLVPEMDVDITFETIKNHLRKRGFKDVKVKKIRGGYPPSRAPLEAGVIQSLIRTYRKMGTEPEIWPSIGGCAPGYLWMKPPLNFPTFPILGGLGHAGNSHAPNEYLTVKGYRDSMKSAAVFLYEYAKT